MTTTAGLSENSHQGSEGLKASLCLASMEAKSNTASGLQGCLRRKGTGSRCSGKERDETGLDYFGARYFSSALGRWTSPDPLYLELNRLPDPQQLNIYVYGRNNPLKFIDPTGLDIKAKCGDKDDCKTATNYVNNRQGGQFTVEMKEGKWKPVGDVDKSALSSEELAFYEALTNPNQVATLSLVSDDGKVLFGENTGDGKNTADVVDMAALAEAGISPGNLVAHEAMEAYATEGGASLEDAHNNNPFPGFTGIGTGTGKPTARSQTDPMIRGYVYQYRYNKTGAYYQVNTRLKSPIPKVFLEDFRMREIALRSKEETNVTVKPK